VLWSDSSVTSLTFHFPRVLVFPAVPEVVSWSRRARGVTDVFTRWGHRREQDLASTCFGRLSFLLKLVQKLFGDREEGVTQSLRGLRPDQRDSSVTEAGGLGSQGNAP